MNSGGSYIKDKNGNAKKVAGTVNHKDGDRARNADGDELRKIAADSKQKAKDEAAAEKATSSAKAATPKKGEK